MSGFVRTIEADIAAPVEDVFAYVCDLTKHPEWADQPMTIEHVGGPANGPGATFKTHVVIDLPVGHKGEDATVVVKEADAPRHHLAYEATGSDGHYRWTIDLTGDTAKTHVTQTCERLEGPLWVRVAQPLMWKAMGGKMVSHGLMKMKDRMEHGPS
jgi:uncharacterized protein YndB with AHSA1/START domain